MKRMLIALGVLALTGCANVRLDDVGVQRYMKLKVFMPGDPLPVKFKVIDQIKERSLNHAASLIAQGPESAIEEAKKRAAEAGANGLIIKSVTNIGFTWHSGTSTYECLGEAVVLGD